jgi:ABC-2 type transport system ATP-binding protein
MVDARTSIVVDNVYKDYKLRYHRTLKQVLVAAAQREKLSDRYMAVNGVSFEVQQGEAIGLMGLNGSGKTTMLRMISGVLKPTAGTVRTRGRIAGLIATSAGFHPQLTGRENIFLNAATFGMSKKEVELVFDDIVEFAGIGRFLDVQVSTYSSGMHARLGFAVAVHADSDIFIIDEALAVGDQPFKRKCLAKIKEIRDSGRTMFYVSHSAPSVAALCDRVIVLEEGKLGFDGDPTEAIRYLGYGSADDELNDFEDEDLGGGE